MLVLLGCEPDGVLEELDEVAQGVESRHVTDFRDRDPRLVEEVLCPLNAQFIDVLHGGHPKFVPEVAEQLGDAHVRFAGKLFHGEGLFQMGLEVLGEVGQGVGSCKGLAVLQQPDHGLQLQDPNDQFHHLDVQQRGLEDVLFSADLHQSLKNLVDVRGVGKMEEVVVFVPPLFGFLDAGHLLVELGNDLVQPTRVDLHLEAFGGCLQVGVGEVNRHLIVCGDHQGFTRNKLERGVVCVDDLLAAEHPAIERAGGLEHHPFSLHARTVDRELDMLGVPEDHLVLDALHGFPVRTGLLQCNAHRPPFILVAKTSPPCRAERISGGMACGHARQRARESLLTNPRTVQAEPAFGKMVRNQQVQMGINRLPFGGVGGDEVHQRGRQAIVGFKANLLQPCSDRTHVVGIRSGLDDRGDKGCKFRRGPAILIGQFRVDEIQSVEGVPLIFDPPVHVHTASLAGVTLNGRARINDLKLVSILSDADIVSGHHGDL